VEGNRQGLVFYGASGPHAAPWYPGNASVLCVRQPLQRTPPRNSGGATGSCGGVIAIDWNEFVATHPGALAAPPLPGQRLHAQVWYRDPGAAGSMNLTNALEFTVQP